MVAVFAEGEDKIIGKAIGGSESRELPFRHAQHAAPARADPEVSLLVHQKRIDIAALHLRRVAPVEDGEAEAIKARQALFGSQPEVPIGGLGQGNHVVLRKSVGHMPASARVLGKGLRRVQAHGALGKDPKP